MEPISQNMHEQPPAVPSGGDMDGSRVKYIGFWARTVAAIVNTILLMIITVPLVIWLYGSIAVDMLPTVGHEYLGEREPVNIESEVTATLALGQIFINWVLPAVAFIGFWMIANADPGKMLFRGVIVDAHTLQPASKGSLILRYIGYFIATLPLCLGLFWVGWDKRKQGWHDKIAGTVVVDKSTLG